MSDAPALFPLDDADAITRMTGPETTNGTRWEVQLSAAPTREWLGLFKAAGAGTVASGAPTPQRVVFDRASANFRSEEDRVEEWIAGLDRWIAWTNARYRLDLEEASRQRVARAEAEAAQRERIERLNDRFRTL